MRSQSSGDVDGNWRNGCFVAALAVSGRLLLGRLAKLKEKPRLADDGPPRRLVVRECGADGGQLRQVVLG